MRMMPYAVPRMLFMIGAISGPVVYQQRAKKIVGPDIVVSYMIMCMHIANYMVAYI